MSLDEYRGSVWAWQELMKPTPLPQPEPSRVSFLSWARQLIASLRPKLS